MAERGGSAPRPVGTCFCWRYPDGSDELSSRRVLRVRPYEQQTSPDYWIIHEAQANHRQISLGVIIARRTSNVRRSPTPTVGLWLSTVLVTEMRWRVTRTTATRRIELRPSHECFADVTEVVEEWPRTRKEHAYATCCRLNSSGNADQSHPPCTHMACVLGQNDRQSPILTCSRGYVSDSGHTPFTSLN